MWRARVRDDDGRVWRANALSPLDLWRHWAPAKPGPEVAALASLRPVALEVRAETEDGRAASRVFVRRLLGDGVRVRRWKDLGATLYLPAGGPAATLVVAPGETDVVAASLAAALLASRGVVVVVAAGGRSPAVRDRLRLVSGAGEEEVVHAVPLPPGVPAVGGGDDSWRGLLSRLGARPLSP